MANPPSFLLVFHIKIILVDLLYISLQSYTKLNHKPKNTHFLLKLQTLTAFKLIIYYLLLDLDFKTPSLVNILYGASTNLSLLHTISLSNCLLSKNTLATLSQINTYYIYSIIMHINYFYSFGNFVYYKRN